VAINCFSANENETTHYEELMDKVGEAMGCRPEAVAADRAYSINSIFEYNTRRDIATVAPWRKTPNQHERREADTERWDRHGIPRCPACGGAGDLQGPGLGLYFARGEPRLRFKCELRITDECQRTYSIACSENWRMLVPMSRLSEPYHALRKISKNRERVFRHWRDRYSVFGNNFDLRPKRCGIAWQNLRASFALLIEWFRLCARYGWLGSARRSDEYQVEEIHGASILNKLLRSRLWHALNLPYGQAAYRLGLAPDANPPPEPEPRART
jgi:hypothetical protein